MKVTEVLDSFPLWTLLPVTVLVALVSAEFGYRVARYRRQQRIDLRPRRSRVRCRLNSRSKRAKRVPGLQFFQDLEFTLGKEKRPLARAF